MTTTEIEPGEINAAIADLLSVDTTVPHENNDYHNDEYPFPCEKCPKKYKRPQGLGVHMHRAHGIAGTSNSVTHRRKANGKAKDAQRKQLDRKNKKWAAATAEGKADLIFAAVGDATRVLFPKGVPVERIIEVAELQKAMLEVLNR